jgi:hypothetical protein
MVKDGNDGHYPAKQQRAASTDRRARLAKALKANIARRKAAAPAQAETPAPRNDRRNPGREPVVTEPGETGPGKTGPGKTGPRETGPGETGPRETGPRETGPGETGPGETGSGGTSGR